jgi:hypothetical protein
MTYKYDDAIIEDADDQVADDEMSPAEAGFQKGAEEAQDGDPDSKEDDEVR